MDYIMSERVIYINKDSVERISVYDKAPYEWVKLVSYPGMVKKKKFLGFTISTKVEKEWVFSDLYNGYEYKEKDFENSKDGLFLDKEKQMIYRKTKVVITLKRNGHSFVEYFDGYSEAVEYARRLADEFGCKFLR